MIRALRLPLDVDIATLRADLAAVEPLGYRAHFNTQYYRGDWSGIVLRGQPGARVPLYSDPTRSDFSDTDAMRSCTQVPAILAQLQCPIEAVRFLKLASGAQIREHQDLGLAFEYGTARVHVPVHTHPDVEFFLGDEPLALQAGEAWYLNFDLKHRIDNRSAQDRVHLVIDLIVNDWFKSLIASALEHR